MAFSKYQFAIVSIFITIGQCQGLNKERELLQDENPTVRNNPPCYPSDRKYLQISPGNGWDSLQNLETKPIFERKFSQCQTTSDGQYIIPDNTFSVHIQSSNLNTESETIEHWKDYTDISAKTISTKAQFRVSTFDYGAVNIAGTYSTGYTKLKDKLIAEKTAIYRTQARYTKYTVEFQSNQFRLDSHFNEAIQNIAKELELNQFERAKIMVQLLIRDYGTHCIIKISAGAILVIEKTFSNKAAIDNFFNASSRSSASTSGYNFFELVKFYSEFESKFNHDVKSNAYGYSFNNRTTIMNYGGSFFNINGCNDKCLVDWLNSVPNSLATIDRDGKPLWELLLPEYFPNIRRETLGKISGLIKMTVEEYYKLNTHFGCMDPIQINFNYNANVEDDSCSFTNYNQYYNFTFNGIYQTCSMNFSAKNVGNICNTKNLSIKNPLTGAFSCPTATMPVEIYSGLSAVEKCIRKWYIFWKKDCESSIANVETFWCRPLSSKYTKRTSAPGILFGGMYSKSSLNPITSDESCPKSYNEVKILNDATFCVGTDHNPHNFKNSIGFGGMFTCKHENPLGKSEKKFTELIEEAYSCPDGYSQQIVTNIDDCYIFYCLQFHSQLKPDKLKIKLPPFVALTGLYSDGESSDVSFIDREKFTGLDSLRNVSNTWLIMSLIGFCCIVIFIIGFFIHAFVYKFKSSPVTFSAQNHVNELFEHLEKEQHNYSVRYGKVKDKEYLSKVSL